jgi:chromosome partitioning protein
MAGNFTRQSPGEACGFTVGTPIIKLEDAMRVICFCNQKGGVGKTISCVNLAVSLAQQGKQVLVMDMDPQGNATGYLGIKPQSIAYDTSLLLDDDNFGLEKAIFPTKYGLDLVPANTTLGRANTTLVGILGRETRLRDKIDEYATKSFRKHYDYIMIDCCPDLNLIATNALMASTDLIVPVQPKQFALEGMANLAAKIGELYKKLDPQIKLLGILVTMYKEGAALDKVMVDLLKDKIQREFGADFVFPEVIRGSTVVSESEKIGPLIVHYPDVPASLAYRKNAEFVMAR